MREYEFEIYEALKNGLSPGLHTPFNTQVLYKCLGFRCGRFGLETYKELENPLPVVVDLYYSWPFPQMIAGEKYNILVVRDDFSEEDIVYSVSDDNSTATQVFVVDKLTFGQGGLMEVADFGEYIFMTNGVIMIYWDPTLSAWQAMTSHARIPMMKTICNFKGQMVGGNVVNSWYDCDETYYTWSKIGYMDFIPDKENTAGYRRCPYGGEVIHVKRLMNIVVGYSDKGITFISYANGPANTLGFVEMYDRGIINRGALDGSIQEHLFIDEDYNIVKIDSNNKINILGYQKHMLEISDEDIIVNYDKRAGDYYIGNSIKTFLLSDMGLTDTPQHPSTVWRRNEESYMLPDTVDDYSPEIITEAFDYLYKGQKTNVTIETDAVNHEGAEAGVDYAYNLDVWNSGEYSPINDQGIATVIAAGNFFRFKLKFDSTDIDFRIGYIKSRYKMTDLRGIRGVYAPPPRGQR